MAERHIVMGVTGASGAPYALLLLKKLLHEGIHVHLLLSDAARVVFKQECDFLLPQEVSDTASYICEHLACDASFLHVYAKDDWFSPVASGSSGMEQMVIAPCSMGTLASIANGMSNTLMERAADVMLKEKKPLILMPRETPLSAIHLEHMLKLSRMGVHMIPAMPAFYHHPNSLDDVVDFMVARLLDHLKVENKAAKRWGSDIVR